MRLCSLCGNEIRAWHSYEIDGNRTAHMACLLGQTPSKHPGDRWSGDPNLMLHPNKHKTVDGRTFNTPPHLREGNDE